MEKIIIEKIYLKESNIEAPNQLEIFEESINTTNTELGCQTAFQNAVFKKRDCYEVTLSLQLATKSEGQFLYVINFIYAGLFRIEGCDEDKQSEILAVDCPNILFPYARLHADYVTKSTGLPAVILQEIDFKELWYEEIGKEYK